MKEQSDKITMAGIMMAVIRISILVGMLFIMIILLITFVRAVYNMTQPIDEQTLQSVQEFNIVNNTQAVAAGNTGEIIMLPEVPEELRKITEEDEELSISQTNFTYKLKDSEPYDDNIDVYTDLMNRMDISEYDVMMCIDYFTSADNNQDSIMNNEGVAAAFIEASKQSGFDVFFLVALAGHESGWSVSDLHQDKWNPYSIGMYDWAPENGLVMGETFEEGIINGANYIRKYWYDEGYTSLYTMKNGGRMYASDENWMHSICSIMNSCYRLINN